jgi:hypothetical protein
MKRMEHRVQIETYEDRNQFTNILVRNNCVVRMETVNPTHSGESARHFIYFTLPKD